ncbi:MAG: SDR family oxidoreductase [Nanoarchaeota archaeon]|nr:SDR family oxidoreductase [Nanoarchaeota archaeon]
MRVLVTGGAGFIGSHLCEFLLKEGHEVICMDNFITGRRKNIQPFMDNPKFTFRHQDVSNFIPLEGKLDAVMHLASPASPIDYQQIPIQTLKVGALGTHNALGLAKVKECRFLLASTSEVYGDPLIHPQPESYWGNVNPVGVRGCYDEAKRFAEAITMAYHRVHKVDTKIARIFNTFGPRNRPDDGRVVPTFINQAIKGEPLTVFGDGSQTRSFCYVEDMVKGLWKLLNSDINEPVNLGNPEEMTVLQFAEKIIKLTGAKSKVVYRDLPIDDPKTRQPDISKAKKLLNWKPEYPVDEGLKKTVEYFKGLDRKL